MTARSYNSTAYRYGFNGKEVDNEGLGGGSTTYDYGFRIYNPALAKFLSVDPMSMKFPFYTPYQFASNSPIVAIDIDGQEGDILMNETEKQFGWMTEEVRSWLDWDFSFNWGSSSNNNSSRTVNKSGAAQKKTTAEEVTQNADKSAEIVHPPLGGLSESYESNGVGTVSGGQGDAGGVSYGNWQLASKKGRPKEFLENEGVGWADDFGKTKPGSKEFSKVWKEIAATDGDAFKLAQHTYIKRTHYDVVHASIQSKTGLVVNSRSHTLQDVLWSTAVHHGPGNKVFIKALDGKDVSTMTDADIIKAVYAERGKTNENGDLAYFSNNSKDVQAGVAARFVKEQKRALKLLAKEEKAQKEKANE